MAGNLPPGCTQSEIDRLIQGDEPDEEPEGMWKVTATSTATIEAYVMALTLKEAEKLARALLLSDFNLADAEWSYPKIVSLEPHEEE